MSETEIKVGDVVSHGKWHDEARFLVTEVEGLVATVVPVNSQSGNVIGTRSLLLTTGDMSRDEDASSDAR